MNSKNTNSITIKIVKSNIIIYPLLKQKLYRI